VAWAYSVKRSNGFAEPAWVAVSFVLLALFIGLLMKALQVLPLGTAYAVWTGIGAVGSLALGILVLGESGDPLRLTFAAITILGIVGLKLSA
jgi:quaternary ammonium compound-resistance protein SugE